MSNVIPMPTPLDVLASNIRAAFVRTEHSRAEWVAGTIELAVALHEARQRFPHNAAFAGWIGENELDRVNSNDRAALVNMGEHIDVARRVLQETQRNSYQLIWSEEIQPSLPSASKTVVPVLLPAIPLESPAILESPVPQPMGKIDPRAAFYGLECGNEIHHLFNSQHRRLIGALLRSGRKKDIWDLFVQAYRAGFIVKTEYSGTASGPNPYATLRSLFPDERAAYYCRQFNISNPKQRAHVRDVILPRMIANREEILADPSKIAEIMGREDQQRQAAAIQAHAKAKTVAAVAAMPTHEFECVMFGQRFWPNPQMSFTYNQVRAACWYFHDVNEELKLVPMYQHPAVRARQIRFSVRWFSEYAERELRDDDSKISMKRVFRVVHAIAGAMEANPEGECKRPPSPTNEGEWP